MPENIKSYRTEVHHTCSECSERNAVVVEYDEMDNAYTLTPDHCEECDIDWDGSDIDIIVENADSQHNAEENGL